MKVAEQRKNEKLALAQEEEEKKKEILAERWELSQC